ncbi:MAG: hypothetical protein ACI92E_001457 [Oceanicoccus sp.]|jgi:hypothetical protein
MFDTPDMYGKQVSGEHASYEAQKVDFASKARAQQSNR